MKLLLDTCAFLWVIEGGPALSATARTAIQDTDNEVFLSAVSVWEIVQKNVLGKLPLPEPPERFVTRYREAHGITSLPLEEPAIFHLRRLPALHRDPFDRMLICQALAHSLSIVTPDTLITQYPVPAVW